MVHLDGAFPGVVRSGVNPLRCSFLPSVQIVGYSNLSVKQLFYLSVRN